MLLRFLLALLLLVGVGLGAEQADAAITLVNSTKAGGNSSSPSVAKPTGGSIGDCLLVFVNHNSGTVTVADNNGSAPMTEDLDHQNGDSGAGGFAVYSRVITGDEGTSLAFTLSSSQRWGAIALIASGSNCGTYDVTPAWHSYGSQPTTIAVGGSTIGVDNAMALVLAGIDGSPDGSFTGVPSGYTEIQTVTNQQPTSAAYKIVNSGATGDLTFSKSSGGGNNAYALKVFSLSPAVAAGCVSRQALLGVGC